MRSLFILSEEIAYYLTTKRLESNAITAIQNTMNIINATITYFMKIPFYRTKTKPLTFCAKGMLLVIFTLSGRFGLFLTLNAWLLVMLTLADLLLDTCLGATSLETT